MQRILLATIAAFGLLCSPALAEDLDCTDGGR